MSEQAGITIETKTNTSADVIIVGGGPAGVAAALELKKRGVKHVIILERENGLGGATRHCSHSPFGMFEFKRIYFGAQYAKRLTKEAVKAGIDIRTGHSVISLGDDATLVVSSYKGLETFSAKRIIVATGNRETPRSARMITGDRPIGILNTGSLQAYIAFHHQLPFRRPIIIGTELVSFSALLTCLTHGARPVAMLERSPYTTAWAACSIFPRILGIPLYHQAEITDIIGKPRVNTLVANIKGKEKQFSCDGVLLTGEFRPESALFLRSSMGVAEGSKGPVIDQTGRCINPLYYAAGNVLRGVETGGFSFREGKTVGENVANDLQQNPNKNELIKVEFTKPVKLIVPSVIRRNEKLDENSHFQLRFTKRSKGKISLILDENTVWTKKGQWLPERRVLIPIVSQAIKATCIKVVFEEDEGEDRIYRSGNDINKVPRSG